MTIFSVVKHVLFHSYIPDFERRVHLRETHVSRSVSPGTFFDCQRELNSFEFMFARAGGTLALTGESEPVKLRASFTTRKALPADGARFALGRNFLPEEEVAGKNKVVIFSHAIWQRVFGGATGVLGRTVLINSEPHTVIGVTEKEFERANNPVDPYDAWLPLVVDEHDRRNRFLGVFGHLKRGVTVAHAQAELDLLMALGATASDVARPILSQGGRLVAFGLILGLAGVLVFGRIIQVQLYQVNAWDPLTLAAITGVFIAVAALACWLPARRATRVDPIVALRAE